MIHLPRATPSAQSVDARAISAFLAEVAAEGMELHSFMLYRAGAIVAEGFWHPYGADRPHMQHSATKSWTATAVGLAIDDGLLSYEDRVVRFFPEHLPEKVSDNLAAMTIRDLLTMRIGHRTGISGGEWRGMKESWVRAFLHEDVPETPGEHFIYSSGSSYMLSAIVTTVTGRTVHDYLDARIFQPLGMGTLHWDLSPEGFNTGGNGLRCLTEDVVKFGVLHLQKGMWEGKRLLSSAWIEDATRNHVAEVWMGALDGRRFLPRGTGGGAQEEKREGYGYQWWMTAHGGFRASGLYGQQLIVLPAQDTVIAFTGGLKPRDPRLLAATMAHIFPALGAESTVQADTALAAVLTRLAAPLPQGNPASPIEAGISGQVFAVDESGIASVRFVFDGQGCAFTQTDHRGTHTITAGRGCFAEGLTSMTGNVLHHEYQPDQMRVLAHAVWESEHRLVMTWCFVETAFRDTVVCEFSGKTVTINRSVNTNAGPLAMPVLTGKSG